MRKCLETCIRFQWIKNKDFHQSEASEEDFQEIPLKLRAED